MYQKVKSMLDGIPETCVKRIEDGAFIPFDPANSDYQAFLLWKSQGNEPLPSDE